MRFVATLLFAAALALVVRADNAAVATGGSHDLDVSTRLPGGSVAAAFHTMDRASADAVGMHGDALQAASDVHDARWARAATINDTIMPSDGGCDSWSPHENRCVDYLRRRLRDNCAATSTVACGLRFGPGNFILMPPPPSSRQQDGAGVGALFRVENADTVTINGDVSQMPQVTTVFILTDNAQLFRIINCSQVTLAAFVSTQLRVPYTYGRVVSHDTVRVNATQYPVNTTRYPWLAQSVFVNGFRVMGTEAGRLRGHYLSTPYLNYVHRAALPLSYGALRADGTIDVTVHDLREQLTPGDHVVLRHLKFKFVPLVLQLVRGLRMEAVVIASAGGQALTCSSCADVRIRYSSIVPNKGYPMSVNAGGLIFTGYVSDTPLLIERTAVIGTGDDTFNVNTALLPVGAISSDRRSITLQAHEWSHIGEVRAGSTVTFWNTSTLQTVATAATPTGIVGNGMTLDSPLPAGVSVSGAGASQLAFYADNDVPTDVMMWNNSFGYNIGRTMLIRGRNVQIKYNTLAYTLGPAIYAFTDACFFWTGVMERNVVIEGNTILSPLMGKLGQLAEGAAIALTARVRVPEPRSHLGYKCVQLASADAAQINANVSVVNNTFDYHAFEDVTVLPSLQLDLTDGGVVRDNHIVRYHRDHDVNATKPARELAVGATSTDVVVADNTCVSAQPGTGDTTHYPC